MKVLWFSHKDVLNPTAGGAERTTFEIARRWAKQGWDVEVVCSAWMGAPRNTEADGVRIRRYFSSVGPHLVQPAILRESTPVDFVVDDLAHAVPWGSPIFTDSAGIAFFRHLHRRTLSGQVSKPAAFILEQLERLYPKFYKKWPFVTESRASVRDLNSLGIPLDRIYAIPPGVDHEVYRPGPRSPNPRLVHFAGLRKYKRPDHALYVLRGLRDRGIEADLVVIGSGQSLQRLRLLTRELGLTKHVSFLGRLVSATQVNDVVAQCWVNVHPSTAEGWGLSIIEASAAGVPTIGYDVPGVNETIVSGVNGLIVPDGDVEALTQAATRICRELEPWKNSCLQRSQEFSWEETTSKWSNAVREVIALHSGDGVRSL
jgi:glycosyltransferase involved in cell wall biosynthesis